tara:strand:- start:3364 stop:6285 length:2922 start_codon:yes stop_codon:yes gene_type:complete
MNREDFIQYQEGQMHDPLSIQIISADEARQLWTGRPSKNPFAPENQQYGYRNRVEEDNQETSSFYDEAIVVDLLGDHLHWGEAFGNDAYLSNLEHNLDAMLRRYIYNKFHEDDNVDNILYHYGKFLLNRQENHTSALHGERLGPGQVRDVSYYRGSELVTVYAMRKTFNLPAFAFPDTQVQWYRPSRFDGHDYMRNRVFMQSHAPKLWVNHPLRYFIIPIVSDDAVAQVGDSFDELPYNKYMWSGTDFRFKGITNFNSTYRYADNNEYGESMFYDFAEDKWKLQPEEWGRKFRECNFCRGHYSTHFLTWYKRIGSYGNTRNRICFICNSLETQSYNVPQKTFVSYPATINRNNAHGFDSMANDQYVNFVHGLDTPTARGARDYAVNFIDDSDYQTEITMNDTRFYAPELPVDARKYLSWLYKSFKHVSGSVSTQLIVDLLEWKFKDEDNNTGYEHMWGDDSEWTDDSGNYQSVGEKLEEWGAYFPNAYIYDSENPVADTLISLRIDSADDERIWYINRRGDQPSTGARVEDDNWLSPDHGISNLNIDKNEYRFAPRFYYVNHDSVNGYTAYPTDHQVENDSVPEYSCNCNGCIGDGLTHPTHSNWHYKTGLHLGLELELVARDTRLLSQVPFEQLFERTIEVFHPDGYRDLVHSNMPNPQLLYAKRDGSLPSGSGVEYISQPMTLAAWHQVPEKFWNFVEANYKAFRLDDVGIHIHFPWASMNLAHAYAMLSALNTLQMNQNGLLLHVAQRPTGRWAAWDLLQYRDTFNVVAEIAKERRRGDSEKYKAINTEHSATIELRYFKSNAKGSRVMKNLEFVDAIYQMTRQDVESVSYQWDSERDMPSSSLIDIVAEYANTSSKYKVDHVHHEDTPVGHYVERKIFDFVNNNIDRYPNLHAYLGGFTMNLDDTDRDLTLDDIGYWSIPEVDETEEEEIHDDVDRNFSGLLMVETSDTMTLLGTTYTVSDITTDTQEV